MRELHCCTISSPYKLRRGQIQPVLNLPLIPALHVSSSSDHNSLPRNIPKQRTRHRQNTTRGLCRRPWSAQGNIRFTSGLPSRLQLLLWNPQFNLLSIGRRDERALLLRLRQPRSDAAKRNGVGSHSEHWTPFFGNDFGEARDSRFRKTVVGLAGVAVYAGGRGDVDDAARFVVFDAEIGGGFADELEGGGAVESDDVVPLLVGHL